MILKLMKKQYSPLVFSLFCGFAYFLISFSFIMRYTENGGMLLAFFFFPAIVCGTAIFIIKAVKMYLEEEKEKKLNFMFWSHILLMIVAIALAIGALI